MEDEYWYFNSLPMQRVSDCMSMFIGNGSKIRYTDRKLGIYQLQWVIIVIY